MKHLKSFFSFSVGSVVGLILSVISLPILTRIIEPTEFGYVTIFQNIAMILGSIALFGFDQALVRFFYNSNQRKLVQQTFLLSAISTSVIIFIAIIFNEDLSSLISPQQKYAGLLILYIISLVIFRFSNLILRMMQLGLSYSLVEIMRKLLDFIFIISLVFIFVPTHNYIIIGYCLSLLSSAILSLILSRKFWRKEESQAEKIKLKKIIIYSFPLMTAGLLTILLQTMDKILLNYWSGSQEVGVYSGVFKLVTLISIIHHVFTVFWAPTYLKHYEENSNNKVLFGRVSRLVSLLMAIMCFLIILFKDYLVLFLGVQYRDYPALLAPLVLMPAFLTMSEANMIGINIKLKAKYHLYISFIVVSLFLFLSYLLIPALGKEGAALTIGITYFILYILRTVIGQRLYSFDIKLKSYLFLFSIKLVWIITLLFNILKSYQLFLATIIFALLVIYSIREFRNSELKTILNVFDREN